MTKNGKRQEMIAPPTEKNTFSLIPNEKLLELYSGLLKWQLIRGRALDVLKDNKTQNKNGCEAALVAVAADIDLNDSSVCLDDHLFAAMVTGVPLETLLSSLSSDRAALSRGNGSAATDKVITETASNLQLNYLLGAALSNKVKNNGRIGVVLSDNRSAESLQHALKAAAECKLPIIFVVRGNTNAPRKQPLKTDLDEASLPVIGVDGNDAVASYRVAHEAIERARRGRGPTLIDCQVYRVGTTSKVVDPIKNMEDYLRGKGLMTAGLTNSINEKLMREYGPALKNA